MASFWADEHVPKDLVIALRDLGHDVLTAREAGRADLGVPDAEVLRHATTINRTVLTNNRWDFVGLHAKDPNHCGIVAYTDDDGIAPLADRIHAAIAPHFTLNQQLIRVNLPSARKPK